MKLLPLLAVTAIAATPVTGEETRQLDAHEHGVGQLNIAIDGQQIAMELHAPGADIVGFEYAAESAKDLAAVDMAVTTLTGPLGLFVLPNSAECTVVEASAGLESEEGHDEHAHDDHDEDEHAHDDHDEDEHAHDDHDEDEHAHDDHDEDEHAHDDHDEDEHDEDEHAAEAGHTEFHAEYFLTCAAPSAITEMTFAYFDVFPNALEVEVQIISDTGATSFEVERDAPVLDLRGMF